MRKVSQSFSVEALSQLQCRQVENWNNNKKKSAEF